MFEFSILSGLPLEFLQFLSRSSSQSETGENHVGVEHGNDHVLDQDDKKGTEGDPQDIALSADRVDSCAGCDNIVGADEVAQRARGVLTGKNCDGIDAQQLGCLNVHTGEHNVGPQSGAGDKGAERADEDSRRAFQKDRHEDTDDDELGTAVFSGKLCDRSLYVLNGTGGFEGVQNGKGAEDHDDDLEAFLEALPDARVQDSNIILQAQVCDIEIGQSEEHSPQKCDRRDFCRRHTKGHDPDQYNGDRTDCKNKLILNYS